PALSPRLLPIRGRGRLGRGAPVPAPVTSPPQVTSHSPSPPRRPPLQVAPPEGCTELSALGDTVQIHYTGSLEDGRIIDTSLTRDPLQVELGKRQVIPGGCPAGGRGGGTGGRVCVLLSVPSLPAGLEQSLLDMCVG
uniref:peptidylprolyl isomerase n=1 Tax=Nothoprocta perdicaria TaxID=30464 RepID=A0A8C6ZPW8_NOTPE